MHGVMLGASRASVRGIRTVFEGLIAVLVRSFARMSPACETSTVPLVAEDLDHGSTWHPSTHRVRSARTRVILIRRTWRPTWPSRSRDLPLDILPGGEGEGNDRVRISLSNRSSASLSIRSFEGVGTRIVLNRTFRLCG